MRSLVPGYLKGSYLHNCRFISQAWPTRHFARDERESRGEGKRKDHHLTKYKVYMTRNFFTVFVPSIYVFNHFGSSKMCPLSGLRSPGRSNSTFWDWEWIQGSEPGWWRHMTPAFCRHFGSSHFFWFFLLVLWPKNVYWFRINWFNCL